MDDPEEAFGFSWGHEIVPPNSGSPNEEETLKQTRNYSSFHLDGIVYHVYDTVYLVASDGPRSIAKILTLSENVNKKEKRMSVRWFRRSCELPARVAGVNYRDEDSKEIFIAWGEGSKSVVKPASIIRKCNVVCTAPQDWNSPHPTREMIAAADHLFGYAFNAGLKQVISLDGLFRKFGLTYFCSPDRSQTSDGTRRKAAEHGSKVAERVDKFDGHDPQPRQRASHTSVAVRKNSGGSKRETLELGIPVGGKRKAVDRGTEFDGSPSIQDLIAMANEKKLMLTESKLPSSEPASSEPASLKRRVASDSWPIGHGDQRPQNPVTFKRPTGRDPLSIGRSDCLKTSKSAQTELAGKQVQDPGLNPSRVNRGFSGKQVQDPGLNPSRVNQGFSNVPWHVVLDFALEKGRALLLQNLDPLFSSRDIQDILTGLLGVSCEARMLLPRDFSCYTKGEALVVFKSREEADDAFLKFTENVLILTEDKRPVVASLADKQRRTVNPFHGFLNLGMFNVQLPQMGCSTSHCSQPNTVVFDMGMHWRLLQERHSEAWKDAAQSSDSSRAKLMGRVPGFP